MPPNPRTSAEHLAHELLALLAELTDPPTLRVMAVSGRVGCLIQVWDTATMMPTAALERRPFPGGRAGCRADVLEVVTKAGRPMTRKDVVRALRAAGKPHGIGTVAKALAELTKSNQLVNPRDKKGYRPAGWRKTQTPGLF
jgi:hypothetical protein